MQPIDTDQRLSSDQAAIYLGVAKSTLPVWRSTQKVQIPYAKIGRKVIYLKSTLDRFLAQNTHGAEVLA